MNTTVNFSIGSTDFDDESESGAGGSISSVINIAIDSFDTPFGGAIGTTVDVVGITYDQSSNGFTIQDVYQGVGELSGGVAGSALTALADIPGGLSGALGRPSAMRDIAVFGW